MLNAGKEIAKGSQETVLVEVSISSANMEISLVLPQKLKLELQYYPPPGINAKD